MPSANTERCPQKSPGWTRPLISGINNSNEQRSWSQSQPRSLGKCLSKPLTIDPAVLQRLRRLSKAERTECLLALCDLVDSFGRPHAHSGLGIRKLGNKLFECRGNVELRFIFQDRP